MRPDVRLVGASSLNEGRAAVNAGICRGLPRGVAVGTIKSPVGRRLQTAIPGRSCESGFCAPHSACSPRRVGAVAGRVAALRRTVVPATPRGCHGQTRSCPWLPSANGTLKTSLRVAPTGSGGRSYLEEPTTAVFPYGHYPASLREDRPNSHEFGHRSR